MSRKIKILLSEILIFIFIFSLFISAAFLEYNRSVEIQNRELQDQISLLQSQIDNQFNQRIQTVRGLIPYVQINPDITEFEFTEFASKMISKDDLVIKLITLIKDTTIAYVYPKDGSENAIGVDLATVSDQRDAVLAIKETGKMSINGPFTLVEGGIGLILRIPIFLNPESTFPNYYGQAHYVADFDELMKQTGITSAMDDYYIRIIEKNDHPIISNYDDFDEYAIISTLHLPGVSWQITMEYKNGYNGHSPFFYFLIYTGIFIGLLSMLYLRNILISRLELEQSLIKLKKTQEQLILSEKLAALGGLTAGVAHEINTPLGVSITLTSFIEKKVKVIQDKYLSGNLSKKDLEIFIHNIIDSSYSLSINLSKASDLVKSFKMLAADQHSNELRKINLKKYINEIVYTFIPEIKKHSHTLVLEIENIEIYTDPIAISRIVTNLVTNSLTHGFENLDAGNILIEIYEDNIKENIIIKYHDDGLGISDDLKEKIFTPFFSTKRSQGNTGLGLHIIHTAVVKSLNGSIDVSNDLEKGLTFTIKFPINH